jgi:predicted kinase
MLIVISGLPCTGKTTIAKELSKQLDIPFVGKDDIKEFLFNTVGWDDLEWSRKLGAYSYKMLYNIAEMFVSNKKSLIIESNFDYKYDFNNLFKLKIKYGVFIFEIQCNASPEAIWERFKQRWESGERHRGHLDDQHYKQTLLSGYRHPNIGKKIINTDTTNFDLMYSSIIKG